MWVTDEYMLRIVLLVKIWVSISHVDIQIHSKRNFNVSVDIEMRTNMSYVDIEKQYLRRNHPLIIGNSHLPWHEMHSGFDFIEFLYSDRNLKESRPCNIITNSLISPRTLGQLLKQIDLIADNEKWFFQLRNCEFDAIKASRAIIPIEARPQFLSQHLPPFRSSWILASQNYEMKANRPLNLRHLVVVLQLSGTITGHLQPNEVCLSNCIDLEYQLNEGESMIFSSDMWSFSYRALNEENYDRIISTLIQEIES